MNHLQNSDSSEYPYIGAERLEQLRPYRFAAFGGSTLLNAFAHSRDRLLATLRGGRPAPSGVFEGLDRLTRDAHALRPDVLDRLEDEMDRLRLAWEVESAAQLTETTEILEDILVPFLRARVPLRPRAQGTAWAHDVVLRLLERFDVYGCVHASYDQDWRKGESRPNEPGACVRLALAAGWLGWSDLLVDPAASLDHLNVLLKVDDLVDAGVHQGEWQLSAFERDAALAALELESRLLRHWRRHRRRDEEWELH